MKNYSPLLCAALFVGSLATSTLRADDINFSPKNDSDAEIELGDLTIEVVRSLGTPKGQMDKDERKLLYYPRGLVDIKGDRVFEYKLISQEQLEARERRRQEEQAAKEREMAELHALMLEEAAEEMQRVKDDEFFEAQPAAKRVAYWKSFQKKYPGAPLDTDSYQRALVQYNDAAERSAMEAELERLRKVAEENDPGPKPTVSSSRAKKLKRAGQWKWGDKEEEEKK